MTTRREWLVGLSLGTAGLAVGSLARAQARNIDAIRKNWRDLLAPTFEPPARDTRVELTADAWRERLEPAPYRVLREEETEPSGASPLNDEHRDGVYVCAGCNLPVFTSEMKFESGTGWPSFFTTIPDVFETKRDFVLLWPRTEYHCVRCGGHHGHVFDDGPPPTNERWCNNGAALKFVPRSGTA
jgi:peptide-methionine (R)-S-oxide reductase